LHPRLLDVQEMRLREMDKHGIEMMILSLNAPAIIGIRLRPGSFISHGHMHQTYD